MRGASAPWDVIAASAGSHSHLGEEHGKPLSLNWPGPAVTATNFSSDPTGNLRTPPADTVPMHDSDNGDDTGASAFSKGPPSFPSMDSQHWSTEG